MPLEPDTPARRLFVRVIVAVMATLAVLKLGDEFRRLVLDSGVDGAVDLRLRHAEVAGWFAGQPVYRTLVSAIYPPASYTLLWPLMGWLPIAPARWLWGVTTVAAVAATLRLTIRDCPARARSEQWFVALLLLSMNATGVVIGNGQLALHVLPLLLVVVLWVHTKTPGWPRDCRIAACFSAAAVKPNLAAPFFWLLLFRPGGLRPAALTVVAYAGLTALAIQYQADALPTLVAEWIAAARAQMFRGYGDINSLILATGWGTPTTALDLSLLGVWGAWTFRHRNADRWLLLDATALFTRFWTYHRVYDDVLVFLAEIALFRIASGLMTERPHIRRLAEPSCWRPLSPCSVPRACSPCRGPSAPCCGSATC